MKINSESKKRLIIKGKVNNKDAYFLVDTGATVGILNKSQRRKYDLVEGRQFPNTLIGAGGEMESVHYCNTFVEIAGKTTSQYLLSDIDSVCSSIKTETGISIIGIIGLPQMKQLHMTIDTDDNYVEII